MHLQGLDLNLLIALEALLTEKNVTRAAERINISQPGMSAALQKLRWHFSDELLERIGRRMELTARGRALADPVREILFQVRALTRKPEEFDPKSARRCFILNATTFRSGILGPRLINRIESSAPNISVQFEELHLDTINRLVDDHIDFAITADRILIDHPNVEPSLLSANLFDDRFVIAASKDNDLIGSDITFEELCSLPYIETRFDGSMLGISETIWRQQPKRPNIRAWFPNFHLTLDTVIRTNMVAVVPTRIVSIYENYYKIKCFPVPLDLPIVEERLFWHRRDDLEPAHAWFRNEIQKVVLELTS